MTKGWRKESVRHSKSAQGIKTGRKAQAQSNMKFKNDDIMFPKDNLTIEPTYVPRGSGNDPNAGERDLHYKIKEWGFVFPTKQDAEKFADEHIEVDGKIIEKSTKKEKPKPKPKSEFLAKKTFTEKDVLLAKRRLNAGKITYDDIFIGDGTNKQLTPEQSQKGIAWLQNQWKSPSGVERKNNPFGAREEAILEDATEIELKDYVNLGRGDFKNYQPVYEVLGDNTSFEYYVSGGEISITG